MDRILEEIPILRPTILSGPPITWITVHQLYTQALNAAYGPYLPSLLLSTAVGADHVPLQFYPHAGGAKSALEKQELKAQIMTRFRKMLGGGCIRMITIGTSKEKEKLQLYRQLKNLFFVGRWCAGAQGGTAVHAQALW